MAKIETSSNDSRSWKHAFEQLSKAVSDAEDRVKQQRLKRRSLLEAICSNITTDGKLAPSSKWEVLPIYQSKAKSKKSKTTKTNKTQEKPKKKVIESKKTSSDSIKKIKLKAKPRLKMKVKPAKKQTSDIKDEDEPKPKIRTSQIKLKSKKRSDRENDDIEESSLGGLVSKVRRLESSETDSTNYDTQFDQQVSVAQQEDQLQQEQNIQLQNIQRQQMELERHQQQQFHSNGLMAMSFYQNRPETFMQPMGNQVMDTALLQQTMFQQQQNQQQQLMQQQQLQLEIMSQQQNISNHNFFPGIDNTKDDSNFDGFK